MEEPHLGLMPQKALQIQYFKMHVALNHSENKSLEVLRPKNQVEKQEI